MARSKKPTSPETTDQNDVEATEAVDAPDGTSGHEDTPTGTDPEAEASREDDAETPVEDTDGAEGDAPLVLTADETVDEQGTTDATEAADPTPDDADAQAHVTEAAPEAAAEPPEPLTPPPPPPPPAPARSAGFIPLFLGGVVAAGVGFAVARYAQPEPPQGPDPAAALSDQAARIADLEDRLASLSAIVEGVANRPEVDGAALREEILAAIPAPDLSALDDIEARIGALTDQVATLADRPAGQPPVGDDQIAAIRAEIDSAVAEARAEMEAAQEQARAELEAAQAEAARVEAEAAAATRRAAAEAAVAQVAAALDAGSAYGDAVGALDAAGVETPAVLAAGAGGDVPTLPELQDGFPDAARAALDAAIRPAEGATAMDRAVAFLRAQTGARSLTPREGDDPDAILSRAEAALGTGDLQTALTELQALPAEAAAAMADWTAAAETRLAALTALAELRGRIETN